MSVVIIEDSSISNSMLFTILSVILFSLSISLAVISLALALAATWALIIITNSIIVFIANFTKILFIHYLLS